MATTVKQIIDAAVATSTFNDQGILATPTELVGVVDRRIKALFADGSKANVFYFGDSADVVGADSSWTRPAAAETVVRVQSGSTLVNVVPFEDQEVEFAPRVFRFGRKYYPVGSDLAGTETLTFFYSKLPTTLTAVTDTLDPLWPEHFNALLILHVARYLATKDQRTDEVALYDGELKTLTESFAAHLTGEDYALVARHDTR